MDDTLVLIDAGFLSKLSKYLGKGKYLKFDIIQFSFNLAKKQNLFCKHIYYYTAPPFQSNKPVKLEKSMKENYDKFIQKLSNKTNITIREGRCQRIVKDDGKFDYNQKGVDTLLTMDLMRIPLEYSKIKEVILIACDSDFVPTIEYLKRFHIKVILYTYYENRKSKFSTSNELIQTVSKYVLIEKEDFNKSKFLK